MALAIRKVGLTSDLWLLRWLVLCLDVGRRLCVQSRQWEEQQSSHSPVVWGREQWEPCNYFLRWSIRQQETPCALAKHGSLFCLFGATFDCGNYSVVYHRLSAGDTG